jgi:hypothetical protein
MHRGYFVSLPAGLCTVSAAFLLMLGGCSGGDDPYGYQKVSGTVTYEDGTPLPGEVYVYFSSEAPPVGNKHAKQGTVQLEKNGDFKDVTSHHYADGIVRGKHKVTLRGGNNSALPATVVPPEYCDVKKTPIEVDTEQPNSFVIKVKKPK